MTEPTNGGPVGSNNGQVPPPPGPQFGPPTGGQLPQRPVRYGPIPEVLMPARRSAYVALAYAAIGLVLGVFGLLAIIVIAAGSGVRMRGEDWAAIGLFGVLAFLLLAVSIPLGYFANRLAHYPTYGFAIIVCAISVGLPALFTLIGLFAGGGFAGVFMYLVVTALGAIPALLIWRAPSTRDYLLGQRPASHKWPEVPSPTRQFNAPPQHPGAPGAAPFGSPLPPQDGAPQQGGGHQPPPTPGQQSPSGPPQAQ